MTGPSPLVGRTRNQAADQTKTPHRPVSPMRELERVLPSSPDAARDCLRVAVVGAGRLGSAIAPALKAAGHRVLGPLGRGESPGEVDAVLLCVPDTEISAAARAIPPGPLVGHCSGATG